MPVSPEYAAQLAATLTALYNAAQQTLLSAIARRVTQGAEASNWDLQQLQAVRQLKADTTRIVAALTADGRQILTDTAWQAFAEGARLAHVDLTAAHYTHQITQVTLRGVLQTAQVRLEELGLAAKTIERSTLGVYREVVSETTGRMLLGGTTRREASWDAMQTWADRGITGFVDRSGRRWEMSAYAEMTARTAATDAMVSGHAQQLADAGRDLVMVSDAPQECSRCRPWEGKVLSLGRTHPGPHVDSGVHFEVAGTLAQAKAAGFMHPNCRHRLVAYFPGITEPLHDTADPAGDEQRQQQRAYERRIRQLKRRAETSSEVLGSKHPDAVQARRVLRAKQGEFKAWRERVGAKDLSYRTSIAKPTPRDLPPAVEVPTPTPTPSGPMSMWDRWTAGRDKTGRQPFNPDVPLQVYGDKLHIADRSAVSADHLMDLESMPQVVHEKLADHFDKPLPSGRKYEHAGFWVGDAATPGLDDFGHLRGVQPRGWPPGETWDSVPGAYDPGRRACALGGGGKGHGSTSLALHEASHAFDHALRDHSSSDAWVAVRDVVFAQRKAGKFHLDPYFTPQGNPSGYDDELFAEAHAAYMKYRDATPNERATQVGRAIGKSGRDRFDTAQGKWVDLTPAQQVARYRAVGRPLSQHFDDLYADLQR